jgi:prepilin-type N-terminal cleavage/methylation domain-containing protein
MRNEEYNIRYSDIRNTPHSELRTPQSKGFTLIELAVVIAILGVMIALVAPMLGELGEANLKRSARHLTGMIRFLHEESQAKKYEYRLRFDIQDGRYWRKHSSNGKVRRVPEDDVGIGGGSLFGQTRSATLGRQPPGRTLYPVHAGRLGRIYDHPSSRRQ